jgi:dTDP-4-amino-4,6-dideoxygalactose transaminase
VAAVLTPVRYGGVVAGQDEVDAVTAVLRGQGWASGQVTAEFEAEAAAVQGRAHALFVNSGSSALLLAMATLPRGARVAMPAVQFPTLYSAAVWCGLQPVLVDVDDSLNMDPEALRGLGWSDGMDAVAFVHMAGNSANVADIAGICEQNRLPLVEDICEAFGGWAYGELAGNHGHICAASTHAAHQIATGEGGLVFTDDDTAWQKMRRIRDWGRAYGTHDLDGYYPGYVFSEPGLNLHASDIQAALGLVQLRRLPEFTERREANYQVLRACAEALPVTLPRTDPEAAPSWYTFPILCDERDKLALHLQERGIESRPIVAGNMARQPVTGGQFDPAQFPVADDVFRRGLWVSVHPALTAEDVGRITAALEEFFT